MLSAVERSRLTALAVPVRTLSQCDLERPRRSTGAQRHSLDDYQSDKTVQLRTAFRRIIEFAERFLWRCVVVLM